MVIKININNHFRKVNYELEELRHHTAPTLDIDDLIKKLIQHSNFIHAAFLFDDKYSIHLRQLLCKLLSATPKSLLHQGWEEFGTELNIDMPTLKV